ncbi:MAG: hypothetical protein FWF24_03600 [Alphaproteobacteria bacterium]|nr:hypothetical protein [Alphaproteobacteria bacterium]
MQTKIYEKLGEHLEAMESLAREVLINSEKTAPLLKAVSEEIRLAAATEQAYERELLEVPSFYSAGCACCADSRETKPSGSNDYLGDVSFLREAGSCVTRADDPARVTVKAGAWLEALGKRGVPVVEVRQHSGCGAMKIIHTYHSMDKSNIYIKDHYGEAFARMAAGRGNLVSYVEKNPSRYDNMGISFKNGTDEEKVQARMALLQGIWNYNAILNKHRNGNAEGYRVPKPVLFYRHILDGGKMYVMTENRPSPQRFQAIPHPDDSDFKEKMKDLLERFDDKNIRDRITSAAQEQKDWIEENKRNIEEAKSRNEMNLESIDMCRVQRPTRALVRSTGAFSGDPSIQPSGAGTTLNFTGMGGVMAVLQENGKLVLDDEAEQFTELARAYGVKTTNIRMVMNAAWMHKLYDAHECIENGQDLCKKFPPDMARLLKQHMELPKAVYKELQANGFSSYQKEGVPISPHAEDYKANVVACMVVQQGHWNVEAVREKRIDEISQHSKKIPWPLLSVVDPEGYGRTYFFNSHAQTFVNLRDYIAAAKRPELPARSKVEDFHYT